MKKHKTKERRKVSRKEKKNARITICVPESWANRLKYYADLDNRDLSPFICSEIIKPWIVEEASNENLAKMNKKR